MASHRNLPAPTQELAATIYAGQFGHLLLIGWLSSAAMGIIYYLIPTAVNKQIFSEKLGNIHFGLTNITLILAVIINVTLAFRLDPLLAAKTPIPQAIVQTMPLPILSDIVTYVGWATQLLFAYNIAKTLTSK